MGKKLLLFSQCLLLVSILSVLIGYSAVNSDLCKYIRVLEAVDLDNHQGFVYLNAGNLFLFNFLAYLFKTTQSQIILYGLLCSLLYIVTVTIAVRRDVNLPIKDPAKFLFIAVVLIVNPLSTNISGLFRSYIASFFLVIGLCISGNVQRLLLFTLSISLQPLTVIPTLLANYFSRIRGRNLLLFKSLELNAISVANFVVICVIPIFVAYQILNKNFSFPEIMIYVYIFSALVVAQFTNSRHQKASISTQLLNQSGSIVSMLVISATLLRISNDTYRMLFPVSILATSSLIGNIFNSYFQFSRLSKTLLTLASILFILIFPIYSVNFRKVFGITDDVLCSQLNDSFIKVVPSSDVK